MGIICDSLVAIKLVFKSDGRVWNLIVQINSVTFLGVRGVSHHPVFTGSCLIVSICVCSAYLLGGKIFVLLVLLKEMRTLGESGILSFFVYGVNQGGWGSWVSPRLPCVTQGVKLTLIRLTSRMVQFIVSRGFVNDEANGSWFLFAGRDASIGCLVQCLPVPQSMTPHLMQASQKWALPKLGATSWCTGIWIINRLILLYTVVWLKLGND